MERLRVGARAVYRFISPEVRTNMYVLAEEGCALIVDPHPSDEALGLLREQSVADCTILLTHEHPDHTCGIYGIREQFNTTLICQKDCGTAIADWDNNRPTLITAMLSVQDGRNGTRNAEAFQRAYKAHIYAADITFAKEYEFFWHGEHFRLVSSPGHSLGSICIIWNDAAIFTGDSLLKDVPAITRLPGGSAKLYKSATLPYLASLNREFVALPGHGPEFRLGDAALWSDYVGSDGI